ncbi:hypothetical protein DICSQDRAFT_156714 [Dichomitus squalens LYAD-421 SS1]|uniref:Uncharacterized protein n=2 Tax=Dichomitus squalens TaxID=114155 RepID=A0A4Q9PH52_9APHY|nr:uncharacterized protein DICSQDRAFT_156714 [Dichomitus squalens LYAD-421 SS1]EJF58519.1 hypothetical protein DICSQDRAFT_156714 [Dichomitus squalens LYAD-421 SS1]TBU25664.1 hypothetical protein BD311DRAFT_764136 [Dichomitus squalens]TBU52812.1 hypothetical protein BD310DRAFT_203570 [Dichomitus squalens]
MSMAAVTRFRSGLAFSCSLSISRLGGLHLSPSEAGYQGSKHSLAFPACGVPVHRRTFLAM